jgi:hypothetical protein
MWFWPVNWMSLRQGLLWLALNLALNIQCLSQNNITSFFQFYIPQVKTTGLNSKLAFLSANSTTRPRETPLFLKKLIWKGKKKRRIYPFNRPWRPIGLWDHEVPTFSRQSTYRWRWGCQPYAPDTPLPPGRFLVLVSVRGWVDSKAFTSTANSMTSSEIQPATFRPAA